MAKIKFGMMMTDARGKLGGQVFSKNRSGAYVRTKVTPVNPRTTAQQANRALLGNLSSEWSALTSEQRASWNGAVESWLKTNVFGDTVKPTGKNLFTGLNKNMLQAFPSNSVQLIAPAKEEFAVLYLLNSTYNQSTNGVLVFELNTVSGNGRNFRVRVTPPLSAGTSYYNNQLRTIGTSYPGNETATVTLGTDYTVKYGSAPAGSVIFIEVTEIKENGQLGVPSVSPVNII